MDNPGLEDDDGKVQRARESQQIIYPEHPPSYHSISTPTTPAVVVTSAPKKLEHISMEPQPQKQNNGFYVGKSNPESNDASSMSSSSNDNITSLSASNTTASFDSTTQVIVPNGSQSTVNVQSDPNQPPARRKLLYYEIDDEPPWYLTAFLGFQHYLSMAGSTVSVPFILTPLMCMSNDDPDKANIISTIIFVSGIVTLLQSTFGTRLPIIQGGSFAFIVPTIAILNQQGACPSLEGLDDDAKTEIWQQRMREVQGAIIISALFEVAFGLFGFVGVILQWITPMTIAPAIAMIGFSLFKVAAQHSATHWGIAILTMVLIVIFSQYIKDWKIPLPFTRSTKHNGRKRYPFFQVFPVLFTMTICWILCYILTATDVFPAGSPARTDVKSKIIELSPWFRVPYPFQWGVPVITVGAVFGMVSAIIASTIESIGDYYACARISGANVPPTHAINRGIMIEGLGCVVAGIWGTGNGTTSYSENIGAISVTKVGARRVIQAAGVLMIINGIVTKIGAVFISIPEPIIGGIFCVVFATVTGVGLANLHGVDLNSPRNIFVIGFSLFFGMTISQWMDANRDAIDVGNDSINQIITILLSTGMFVAGLLGFALDNTIPGTRKERGLDEWQAHLHANDDGTSAGRDTTYDPPLITSLIKKIKFMRWVPISPTYEKSILGKLPTFRKNKKGARQ